MYVSMFMCVCVCVCLCVCVCVCVCVCAIYRLIDGIMHRFVKKKSSETPRLSHRAYCSEIVLIFGEILASCSFTEIVLIKKACKLKLFVITTNLINKRVSRLFLELFWPF